MVLSKVRLPEQSVDMLLLQPVLARFSLSDRWWIFVRLQYYQYQRQFRGGAVLQFDTIASGLRGPVLQQHPIVWALTRQLQRARE